ncbi:MAG: aldo/keto reductase, partial [Gemmatimonadetes bacterium]|nr:aldo/keto reductase [Gemmatimonadota bacterium]
MSSATAALTTSETPLRTLGRSGLTVSEIGVGCWAIGGPDWNVNDMGWSGTNDADSLAGLFRGFELGANHFDTADVYGHGHSERLLGTFLREVPRDSVVIGTKTGYFRGTAVSAYHPLHMRHQLEMSLSNLGTDYIDIYYLHNFHFGVDDEFLESAIEQMRAFREQGHVRCVGMRGPHRYTAERELADRPRGDKIRRFLDVAELVEPDVVQLRFNMLTPPASRRAVFDWARERG